jgi:hypothetical protein
MVNLEEAFVQGSGSEVENLDFEEERSDGNAEIAELINVLQAILVTQTSVCLLFLE